MKISKYIHSCILLEENGKKLLFDPGEFAFIEGKVAPAGLQNISIIVITHNHPDHVDPKAMQIIMEYNPAAVILGNKEVAEKLGELGLTVEILEAGRREKDGFIIDAIKTKHEDILSDSLPENVAYRINEKLINPADSFSDALQAWQGCESLLLPVLAPWLKETEAYQFALRLKPEIIVPVHDGFAKDFFLKRRYSTYKEFFERNGIDFAAPDDIGHVTTVQGNRDSGK